MLEKSNNKFAPCEFDDLVFPNPSVERTIRDYKDGQTTENLLLHGPPGTGKTTIAGLMPGLVEPTHDPGDVLFYRCSNHRKVEELQKKVGNQLLLQPWNSQRRYVILEEVDNLHSHAMELLKSIMDIGEKADALFVLTTNEIEKISWPVKDRCDVVFVAHTTPQHWFSRARKIIHQETGTNPDDQTLESILSTARGSSRQAVKAIHKYLARYHRHHSSTSEVKKSTGKEAAQ